MTTAHRPTWNAAIGGKNQAGNPTRYTPIHAVSGKDLPAQLTLKTRGAGQVRTRHSRLRCDGRGMERDW